MPLKRFHRLALAAALAAGAAGFALRQEPEPAAAAPRSAAPSFPWARTPTPQDTPLPSAPPATAALALPDLSTPPAVPGRQPFRTDAQGHLIVDAPMRLRAEELLALHEGADLAARIDTELAALPAPAAARARDLIARLDAYQAAQRTAFPPGDAPLVPEEGLAQLDTLRAMRASHFGAEAARQMFGEDEAVARRLLELMRDETSASLDMGQKAMRAQARYDLERGTARR